MLCYKYKINYLFQFFKKLAFEMRKGLIIIINVSQHPQVSQ